MVEDEDVFTVPCADAYVPPVQTTKAKKILEEQERRKPPPEKGRTSILVSRVWNFNWITTNQPSNHIFSD